jgi:hypothetical protein
MAPVFTRLGPEPISNIHPMGHKPLIQLRSPSQAKTESTYLNNYTGKRSVEDNGQVPNCHYPFLAFGGSNYLPLSSVVERHLATKRQEMDNESNQFKYALTH